MKRRKTMRMIGLCAGLGSLFGMQAIGGEGTQEGSQPNILLTYADDLGPGMLGCYGQKEIETPNIDELAAQGLKFANFYGCNVCAPARASLLSGLHTGHAMIPTKGGLEASLHIGDISEKEFDKQILLKRPVAEFDSDFLGEVAKRAGYHSSYFGKLGIGFTDTHSMMRDYGFDDYVGLLDSVICWSFYPEYYWENDKKVTLPGNPKQTTRNPNLFTVGKASMTYTEDVWLEKALAYLDEHRTDPFFMVYATQLPHGPASIAPKDYRYRGRTDWMELSASTRR
jgi:arylsulfatase A-like enzyme